MEPPVVIALALVAGVVVVAAIMVLVVRSVRRTVAAALASSARVEPDPQAAATLRELGSLNAELAHINSLVEADARDRAEQQGRLEQGLRQTLDASRRLNDTTGALRNALAGAKSRGQWGERMADDVLRAAGFVEGVNYRTQTAVAGGAIPDFTFLLPDDQLLHMDVKFPLDNYVRSLEATSPTERDVLRVAFLRDMRNRVRELGGRGYVDGAATLDVVLLFVPNESIYSFVLEHDADLVDVALRQQVVLCSPFTLFAVLAIIRQAVEQFRVEQTGDEVLRRLSTFTVQWGKFSDALDAVGRRFESTQKAFDELAGVRRRQLQRTLHDVDALRRERGLGPDDEVAGSVARLDPGELVERPTG